MAEYTVMKCPKCSHTQDNNFECKSCGIIFEKFYNFLAKNNLLDAVNLFNQERNEESLLILKTIATSKKVTNGKIITESNHYIECILERVKQQDNLEKEKLESNINGFPSPDTLEMEQLSQEDVSAINKWSCPFCGESILLSAIKCKHCGEFFIDESHEIKQTKLSRLQGKIWKFIKNGKKEDSTRKDMGLPLNLPMEEDEIKKEQFESPVNGLRSQNTLKIEQSLPLKEAANLNKSCPFCGETILLSAIKCKHCKSLLSNDNTDSDNSKKKQENRNNEKNNNKLTYGILSGVGLVVAIVIAIFIVQAINKQSLESAKDKQEEIDHRERSEAVAREYGRRVEEHFLKVISPERKGADCEQKCKVNDYQYDKSCKVACMNTPTQF